MGAKKNKTLVFSIGMNWFYLIFKDCIRSHEEYCKRNGYEYRLIKNSYKDLSGDESAWLKIVLLINALEAGYENVFFIDADCLIREHAPPLDELIHEGKDIYLASGFSGRINSGVIIVKNTKPALEFFYKVLNDCEVPVPKEDAAPFENGHMIHHGKNNSLIQIIPHDLWNNNSRIDPQSYIQHYSNGKLRDEYLASAKTRLLFVRIVNLLFTINKRFAKKSSKQALKKVLYELKAHHVLDK
ncbi:MAG: hypothetical protein K0Q95_1394 [Bacteroidota bacterium]|jgi:hypothetical protein|nr:hypothetical protein [Bacteroidota bacterium]